VVASLLVAGCTGNTATPTPTPNTTASVSSANVTKALTAKYEENYIITTAFSRKTDDTYTGVVRDKNRTTPANVTFVTFSSEGDAHSNSADLVKDYKSRGYTADIEDANGALLSKTAATNAAGKNCTDMTNIYVDNLEGVGWGVITESTTYCDA
jgi:hypothetical protein